MSELTTCNFCTLRRMRERAKKNGDQITLIGQDVYRHPKDVKLKDLPAAERKKYWAAWFMSLSSSCCC